MSHTQWMKSPAGGPTHGRDIGCERFGCVPLVVIDPEDREQVKRLADIGTRIADPRRTGLASDHAIRSLQAALREFANPKPPKPEEPQGLGAVVEASDGRVWVKVGGDPAWASYDPPMDVHDFCHYRDIDVVEVVR